MQVCPGCGESSPDRFRECPFCGRELAERQEAREERKVLSVVFCDLKDSTALGERLDPESMGEVLDLYFTAMMRVLKRHGGSVQKFIGDAIVAAFGLPVVHEDDALRACRAATEMLAALERLNHQLVAAYGIELAVRMGVHTGEVVVRRGSNDQELLTGDTLNTAARLEHEAGPGQILIGAPTFRLVRDAIEVERLEPMALKGKADLVLAYRLLRVFGDEQASRRHDAPIVGRDQEQRVLLAGFARAVEERRCVMITVLGEAGVGKSRLVRSLIDATEGEAAVLRGRCLPYGEGITFWPILSIVRDACGIGDSDPAETAMAKLAAVADDPEVTRRVASALGWSGEELPVAELMWGIREFLECLARDRSLVVIVDDVHWAASTLLELLDHLLETAADAPILVLCTARPDMVEARPDWSDGPRASRLLLDRLPDAAAAQVIDNLLHGVELPDELRSIVIRAAEGNPLFVEQLVSMLIDTGVLVEADGGWSVTRHPEQIDIPPSINALLTARLDLLDAEERSVIEPASVIGLEFPSEAVRELVAEPVRKRVPGHLQGMVRKQLVREASEGQGFDDHRFHHFLIRDAAYRRSLKRARADLHERFAAWLEHVDEDHARPGEHDEIVGYHLEQAFRYRSRLGAVDEKTGQLGARAAVKLAGAGRRAFVRGDMPAAIGLLRRSVDVLPRHDPYRLALLPDLAEALMETGDFAAATASLDETLDPAATAANEPEVIRASLIRLLIEMYAGPEDRWSTRVEGELRRAIPAFERAGHETGLATAWRMRYGIEAAALRFDAALEAADHVVHHAEAARDPRQEGRGAIALAQAALNGPTPVAEGIARCQDLVDRVEGDRRTTALVRLCLAHLLAMAGLVEDGRAQYRMARDMLTELGPGVLTSSTSMDAAMVEVLAGDLGTAEQLLRRDDEDLEAPGESYVRSTVLGTLARVLALRDDLEASERTAAATRALAAPDDVDAQILWRLAQALTHVRRDQPGAALPLLDEAVELATTTNDPMRTAQALGDRAMALAALGSLPEARQDHDAACELYRAKGNLAALHQLVSTMSAVSGP